MKLKEKASLFSESYLSARKGIPDLRDKIIEGCHAIIIHPKVYKEMQRYIPGFLESRCRTYKFTPHIRNDHQNDTIFVLYIHRDNVDEHYLELQNWFKGPSSRMQA